MDGDSGSQYLSGSECGDWPRLWPIVVQFCLWQWNGGGSWMGIQDPNLFRAPSVVTGLVCGPLLFNSASGNGTAVGHGWGSPCCGSIQWLFCTKTLQRPVVCFLCRLESSVAIPSS